MDLRKTQEAWKKKIHIISNGGLMVSYHGPQFKNVTNLAQIQDETQLVVSFPSEN